MRHTVRATACIKHSDTTRSHPRVLVPLRGQVADARRQWQAFLSAAPGYPPTLFRQRGIAIVSGLMPHIVPTWVTLHMLRRTGDSSV